MLIDKGLAATIKKAIEDRIGGRCRCEVGQRENHLNSALWDECSDLEELHPLHKVDQDVPEHLTSIDGDLRVDLDVYCYETGLDGDLEQNVTVYLRRCEGVWIVAEVETDAELSNSDLV